MSIADRLKNRRLEMGLSLENLSGSTSISIKEINEIEDCKDDQKIIKKYSSHFVLLAKHLQTTVSYITTGQITLALRFKKRRLEMGYTPSHLGRIASVAKQTINEIENETRTYSKYLPNLAKALRTTTEYLLSGNILVSSYPIDSQTNSIGVEQLKEFNNVVRLIPIISWEINSLTRIENMTVSSKTQETIPFFDTCGPHVKAFKIKDDSMVSLMPNSDSFRQSDIIVIDPDKTYDKGSFVIAEIKGKPEFIFRQVIDIAGELFLNPLNPAYPKEKMDDSVVIFGVLITCYRKYS